MECLLILFCAYTGWSKIVAPLTYFFDNFGKSTPILTILSPLQQEIHGA